MKSIYDFDEIRPLYDEEVSSAIERMLTEPLLERISAFVFPQTPYPQLQEMLRGIHNVQEFQKRISEPLMWNIAKKSASSLTISYDQELDKRSSYTYISNHRDIVLDSSFLDILLLQEGFDTCEIAIGDNLLIYPWIEDLVRINKSFIVKRKVSIREMIQVSKRLSSYIHFAIKIKNQSVWIAQREGRAKDSNDRTQEALLKMLSMGGHKSLKENLASLNIAPMSISYEYDPCDYLKAQEFQLKRDNPQYSKTQADDLLNMQTGIVGFKGNIHFHINKPICSQIEEMPLTDKAEEATRIASIIDNEIFRGYRIYPGNHIAKDYLLEDGAQSQFYTLQEKQTFDQYIDKQLAKISIENPDYVYLRTKLLEMYANPLINQLSVK